MRRALSGLAKYVATPRVSKHRVFVWKDIETIPDSAVVAIAVDADYSFGVLHSTIHQHWALRKGTSLEDRPRYTPTTIFETFPFPWAPGEEPSEEDNGRVFAIGAAARRLVELRQGWLHPPEEDVGTVISESMLKRRTLTNLYNALGWYREEFRASRERDGWNRKVKGGVSLELIEELDFVHQELDRAVLAAYGWPANLGEEEILERLLKLNLSRAAKQ